MMVGIHLHRQMLMQGASAVAISLAATMAAGETEALAINFLDDFFYASTGRYGSAFIKDTGTPANDYDSHPYGKLTYTSPSPKMCRQSDGLLKYGPHNLYLNSASPANQSVTVVSGATYTVIITGSVSVTASGAATGTWTAGTNNFTAATTTLTFGSTSGSGTVQVTRTPAVLTYLETTGAVRYELPYEWDASANPLGIRVERASTNLAVRSNDFSLTWSLTNVTQSKTATGPGGVANSATILTASAGNGTATQLIVSSSNARVTSCWIKRRTGTGNIDLTQDNGSTWTTVTVTSGWTLVSIPTQTTANPTIGIRIVTSGDEVDVWNFQHELGNYPTSPIETFAATVTRAVDNITLATTLFPSLLTAGTTFVEWSRNHNGDGGSGSSGRYVFSVHGTTVDTDAYFVRYNGTASWLARVRASSANSLNETTGSSASLGATEKMVIAAELNNGAAYYQGAQVGSTDTSLAMPTTLSSLKFGGAHTSGNDFDGHIRKIMLLPRRMSNADMGTLTT